MSAKQPGKGLRESLGAYFGSRDAMGDEPLPEVSKALIEDAPRVVRLTIWSLIAFFVFCLLWANFAVVDEVTRGDGKAIPSSRLQKIQNLEGGIVAELFVREGQIVDIGDPLLRLDDTRFASNVGETEADRLALLLRVERLSAEVQDRELLVADEVREKVPRQADNEIQLFNSRKQQLLNEVAGLEEQLIQRQQELREFASKQGQFRNSLNLLRQEIRMSEPLVAEGAISPVEVLRLKRAEVEARGQLDATTLAMPRAEAAIKEVERKIDETRGRFRSEALTQLNEARTELSKIQSTGKALEDRVNRTLVISPVRGIVKQLLVNTIGGVIQPGSDLVEIVPLDDNLLVEARIRPQDIAFLHPGQEAMVKFTAYDYTIYGSLEGKLTYISADTLNEDIKQGEQAYYRVQVKTESPRFNRRPNENLQLQPGMTATIEIKTGGNTVLKYLLKPVIKTLNESLGER